MLASDPVAFGTRCFLGRLLGRLGADRPASPARAQAPAARLDVDAQPSCSTRDELIARIAARSGRIRFVADGTGVPALSARIEVAPRGGVVAELVVVEPDGRRFARRLEAPSCAAATDALALVIAITLDPTVAAAEPSRAGADATATPESSPPVVTPAPPPPAPPPAEVAGTVEAAPAGATDAGFTRRLGVGVGATAVTGPAPTVMPGVAVEVLGGLDRASVWSPALAMSFAHLWSGPSRPAGGTAEFTFDVVALDACPLRIVAFHVEARACAAGALGRLAARGIRHLRRPRGGPAVRRGGRRSASGRPPRGPPGAGRAVCRGCPPVARCVPVRSEGVSPGGFGYPDRGARAGRAVSVIG